MIILDPVLTADLKFAHLPPGRQNFKYEFVRFLTPHRARRNLKQIVAKPSREQLHFVRQLGETPHDDQLSDVELEIGHAIEDKWPDVLLPRERLEQDQDLVQEMEMDRVLWMKYCSCNNIEISPSCCPRP